jgi:hypothetical protein
MNTSGKRDRSTRSIPGGTRLILVVWGTVLLLGFLTLPSYFRDPLLLGLAFLCLAISLVHFEAVWSVFLMVLPVLWLIVSMFDQPKITEIVSFC